MRHARGFTLVEVLVALTILSVLAALGWQGVDGLLRAREGNQAMMERTLRLNTAMAQWEQDLLAVQEAPAAMPVALEFDGSTLRLIRRTDAGLQVVAWALRGERWLRWALPPVTRSAELEASWMRSGQLLGNEPGLVGALDGIGAFQVYYYQRGGNGWSNAQSTGDVVAPGAARAAGSATRVALPAGVRLQLQSAAGPITRDLRLSPQPTK